MTRKNALALIRIAGYHRDDKAFVRLYVENRVAYTAAREAYDAGTRAWAAGVGCSCAACRPND